MRRAYTANGRFSTATSGRVARLPFNLLVNYSWRWDLRQAFRAAAAGEAPANVADALGSAQVSRIDAVVRWGGRQRLSGFLPLQCAYADFYALDTLVARHARGIYP